MTTKQLADVYRGKDRKAMLAFAFEAAERIEYLDERLAILTDGKDCARYHTSGWLTPAELIWTLRDNRSKAMLAACSNMIVECLMVLDGLVAMHSGGRDPGEPQVMKTCLTDRTDWPG